MKILKYGDGYPKTVTCDECGSELEYDTNDVQSYEVVFFMDNGIRQNHRKSYIVCPVCKHSIYFEPEILFQWEETPPDHIVLTPSESTKKKRWWKR